jgi:hypothetical protein
VWLAAILAAACAGDTSPTVEAPVTIVASGASNPTVAVSPAGDAWVAWVAGEAETSDVWVAHSRGGGTFNAPVRVNDIAGDAAPHDQAPAQVEAGPEGNVYVLWQNNTAPEGRMYPYSDVRFARSTDGGRSFEPAIHVNDDAAGPPASHTFHDIAVGPDGTVYVSWIDSRVRAERERTQSAGPAIAGALHAGHGGATMPGPEIRIAKSIDGGRTFGPSAVVAENACPCCRTALAVGPAGEVYVSWRTASADNVRDVVVARSDDDGVTFSEARRVHQDDWVFDACPHAGSALAVDARGHLHVAWYTGTDQRPGIYTAVSADRGRSFGEAHGIITGEWVPPSQVKLAALSDGRTAITWDDRRSGSVLTSIAYTNAAGAPTTAAATFAGASPAIASAGRTTVVAWLDGEAVRVSRIDHADGPNGGVSH